MSLQGDSAFCEEGTCEVTRSVSHGITFTVDLRFREAKPEDDEQYRRTGAEPVQWSPGVLGGVDKSPGEDGGQEVAKSITLLQHAGQNASGVVWAVFQCSRRRISVETTHGDTVEGPYGEELAVIITKSGGKFENDEEDVVDHKRPL